MEKHLSVDLERPPRSQRVDDWVSTRDFNAGRLPTQTLSALIAIHPALWTFPINVWFYFLFDLHTPVGHQEFTEQH